MSKDAEYVNAQGDELQAQIDKWAKDIAKLSGDSSGMLFYDNFMINDGELGRGFISAFVYKGSGRYEFGIFGGLNTDEWDLRDDRTLFKRIVSTSIPTKARPRSTVAIDSHSSGFVVIRRWNGESADSVHVSAKLLPSGKINISISGNRFSGMIGLSVNYDGR